MRIESRTSGSAVKCLLINNVNKQGPLSLFSYHMLVQPCTQTQMGNERSICYKVYGSRLIFEYMIRLEIFRGTILHCCVFP